MPLFGSMGIRIFYYLSSKYLHLQYNKKCACVHSRSKANFWLTLCKSDHRIICLFTPNSKSSLLYFSCKLLSNSRQWGHVRLLTPLSFLYAQTFFSSQQSAGEQYTFSDRAESSALFLQKPQLYTTFLLLAWSERLSSAPLYLSPLFNPSHTMLYKAPTTHTQCFALP